MKYQSESKDTSSRCSVIVAAETKMNRYTLRVQRVNLTRVSDIAPGRMECSFEPEDEFGNDE